MLLAMLSRPDDNHQMAVDRCLDDILRVGHVKGLIELVERVARNGWKGGWMEVRTREKGHAFHVWLFHLLGGAGSQLRAPSLEPESRQWSKDCRRQAEKQAQKLAKQAKRAKIAGDLSQKEMDAMLLMPYDASHLSNDAIRVRRPQTHHESRPDILPETAALGKRHRPAIDWSHGLLDVNLSESDPDYQPPPDPTSTCTAKRPRVRSPAVRLTDASGRPCNPDAWHAMYLRMSHPRQRDVLPWCALVRQMGLPSAWAAL